MVIAGWELHLRVNQDWSGILRAIRAPHRILAYQVPFHVGGVLIEAELMGNNRYSVWIELALLGVVVALWLVPLRPRAA